MARSIARCLLVLVLVLVPLVMIGTSACVVDPSEYRLHRDDAGISQPDASLDVGPELSPLPDGSTTDPVDTVDSGTTPTPTSAGGMCLDGMADCQCEGTACSCDADCKVTCDIDCGLECHGGAHCKYEPVGDRAEIACNDETKCDPIRCLGACTVRCAEQAECKVHCDETLGSACLLFCAGTDSSSRSCKIDKCGVDGEGETIDCGGGVFACNRPCP